MWVGVLLVAIIALAAWFRFYDIKNYPPGIFPDVAANGEDVLLILDGDVRPFYPRGNGREALFFYLQALMVKFHGSGVWPMHAASAIIGLATVIAMYFATRPWFGRLSGLLAALFLATNHWHVTLSRTGFRAIMVALFVALFTAFVGYTIREVKPFDGAQGKQGRRAYLYAALAGAALAGGFYTYIAYRVMVGVVLGVALLILLDDWILEWRRHSLASAGHKVRDLPHVMRYGRHLLVGLAAAIIVFIPLGWYFVEHPADFVGRAGQVSIFNPELQRQYGGGTLAGTLLYSTRETLLSFFAGGGDANWRHNVAGYPLLNPLVGVLALLGVAWTIHGSVVVAFMIVRGKEVHLGMVYPYLLLLLLGMLAPVVTTAEGMPHGLRSIGLLVPVFLLAGTAGSVVVYWLLRRVRSDWGRTFIYGAASGVFLIAMAYDGALYFLIARNDPAAHYAYRADLPVVADYIKAYVAEHGPFDSAQGKPYLALDAFSLQSIHYLTARTAHEYVTGGKPHPDEAQHMWRQLNPDQSHLQGLAPGEIIIFTQSTMPDADRYAEHHAEVKQIEQRYNRFGEEIMRAYKSPGEPAPQPGETEAPALDA
jgi:hypothetical protein